MAVVNDSRSGTDPILTSPPPVSIDNIEPAKKPATPTPQ